MHRITLELDQNSIARLESALTVEVAKWDSIYQEAVNGDRQNASAEGAKLIANDARVILDQLKEWKVNNEF